MSNMTGPAVSDGYHDNAQPYGALEAGLVNLAQQTSTTSQLEGEARARLPIPDTCLTSPGVHVGRDSVGSAFSIPSSSQPSRRGSETHRARKFPRFLSRMGDFGCTHLDEEDSHDEMSASVQWAKLGDTRRASASLSLEDAFRAASPVGSMSPPEATWVHNSNASDGVKPQQLQLPLRNLARAMSTRHPSRNVPHAARSRSGTVESTGAAENRHHGIHLPKLGHHATGGHSSNATPAPEDNSDEPVNIMIGEIKPVQPREEVKVLMWYVLLGVLIVLPCTVASLVAGTKVYGLLVVFWGIFAASALLALPVVQFISKVLAYTMVSTRCSRLLYHCNPLYLALVMLPDIALLVWSLLILLGWNYLLRQWVDTRAFDVITQWMGCFVAFRVGWLIKNGLLLLLTTKYLWTTYLGRVQSSIFAQYVLLMLTDFCFRGTINQEDQDFAQEISKGTMTANKWGHISLYAVSKAIAFIPKNKLGKQYDNNGGRAAGGAMSLDSSREARALGYGLFQRLWQASQVACEGEDTAANRNKQANGHSLLRDGAMALKHRLQAVRNSSGLTQSMRDVAPKPRLTVAQLFGDESISGGTPSTDNASSTDTPLRVEDRRTMDLGALKECNLSGPDQVEVEEEEDDELRSLHITQFCPLMNTQLVAKAFALFDSDKDGVITKEEMAQGVQHIYRDHKGLSATLRDSQHITVKLGYILGFLMLFVLMFVWLTIFGFDVLSLTVTFASLLVGCAFIIGQSATALCQSIIYIFIMRTYDVGDRVHLKALDGTLTNAVVTKINLLTTEFRKWDEQVFYMPNNVLATQTLTNIQRSPHQWFEYFIQVSADTPADKLASLQEFLAEFARDQDRPDILYPYVSFSLTELRDSNKLTIRICFRQKSNWQDNPRKWATQSLCTEALKRGCDELQIKYSMPEVPLRFKDKLM